jgi:hypothetical protein
LVARQCRIVEERLEQLEPRLRPVGEADRGGAVQLDDRRPKPTA